MSQSSPPWTWLAYQRATLNIARHLSDEIHRQQDAFFRAQAKFDAQAERQREEFEELQRARGRPLLNDAERELPNSGEVPRSPTNPFSPVTSGANADLRNVVAAQLAREEENQYRAEEAKERAEFMAKMGEQFPLAALDTAAQFTVEHELTARLRRNLTRVAAARVELVAEGVPDANEHVLQYLRDPTFLARHRASRPHQQSQQQHQQQQKQDGSSFHPGTTDDGRAAHPVVAKVDADAGQEDTTGPSSPLAVVKQEPCATPLCTTSDGNGDDTNDSVVNNLAADAPLSPSSPHQPLVLADLPLDPSPVSAPSAAPEATPSDHPAEAFSTLFLAGLRDMSKEEKPSLASEEGEAACVASHLHDGTMGFSASALNTPGGIARGAVLTLSPTPLGTRAGEEGVAPLFPSPAFPYTRLPFLRNDGDKDASPPQQVETPIRTREEQRKARKAVKRLVDRAAPLLDAFIEKAIEAERSRAAAAHALQERAIRRHLAELEEALATAKSTNSTEAPTATSEEANSCAETPLVEIFLAGGALNVPLSRIFAKPPESTAALAPTKRGARRGEDDNSTARLKELRNALRQSRQTLRVVKDNFTTFIASLEARKEAHKREGRERLAEVATQRYAGARHQTEVTSSPPRKAAVNAQGRLLVPTATFAVPELSSEDVEAVATALSALPYPHRIHFFQATRIVPNSPSPGVVAAHSADDADTGEHHTDTHREKDVAATFLTQRMAKGEELLRLPDETAETDAFLTRYYLWPTELEQHIAHTLTGSTSGPLDEDDESPFARAVNEKVRATGKKTAKVVSQASRPARRVAWSPLLISAAGMGEVVTRVVAHAQHCHDVSQKRSRSPDACRDAPSSPSEESRKGRNEQGTTEATIRDAMSASYRAVCTSAAAVAQEKKHKARVSRNKFVSLDKLPGLTVTTAYDPNQGGATSGAGGNTQRAHFLARNGPAPVDAVVASPDHRHHHHGSEEETPQGAQTATSVTPAQLAKQVVDQQFPHVRLPGGTAAATLRIGGAGEVAVAQTRLTSIFTAPQRNDALLRELLAREPHL